jgi:hypothetical protein
MIVRERDDSFIMIEQDLHARVSGEIMAHWKEELYLGGEFKSSVDYAIANHDLGWAPFDQQPFWNDEEKEPYNFVTFPILPKIVLYRDGINEVEKDDTYAALLCSEHYKRFLVNHTSEAAQTFIKQEEERQKRIMEETPNFKREYFNFHYGLVQLGDNISLFLCLNEPGATGEAQHRFLRDGIPLASALNLSEKMELSWKDDATVIVDPFPFGQSIPVHIKQKEVAKKDIASKGLIKAYEDTSFHEVSLILEGK